LVDLVEGFHGKPTFRDYRNDEMNEEPYSNHEFMLDRSRGSLFTVGRDAHEKHMGLRMVLLKSMWHLSEISKYSEILELCKL